jgi:hypothetical protein
MVIAHVPWFTILVASAICYLLIVCVYYPQLERTTRVGLISYDKPTHSHEYVQGIQMVVTGCVYNCAPYLPTLFKKFNQLQTFFNKPIYYIFFENDSTDRSGEMLDSFISSAVVGSTCIRETGLRKRIMLRTRRLAYARNTILDHLRELGLQGDTIVCNVDMDDANIGIDIPSVIRTLEFKGLWDVATANQQSGYYDKWALRTVRKRNDCWRMDTCRRTTLYEWFGIPEIRDVVPTVFPHILRVESAFGGLGLYNLDFALRGTYTGTGKFPALQDCEHVAYHRSIAEQGAVRITIVPFLVNDRIEK